MICVYADISTTDVVLRTALIPSQEETRFLEMTVEYARLAPPDTSRGFCAHITRMLPTSLRIWQLTNCTRINQAYTEIGGAKFLIEDTEGNARTGQGLSAAFLDLLSRIKSSPFNVEKGQLFAIDPTARLLSSNITWEKLATDRTHDSHRLVDYDIFLSYSE